MIRNVVGLFFSPSGETAKITKKITKEIAGRLDDICAEDVGFSYVDLLKEEDRDALCFDGETVVVIGMPVYSGRIPEICRPMIRAMQGNGALTVAVVSYGNNSYGDALYELYSFAGDQGFSVISAGAFVAQHAVFAKVAEDRPDAYDVQQMIEFGKISANKVRRFACTEIEAMRGRPAPLEVKGSMPSKKPLRLPIHPTANALCIKCGACSEVCPVGAIDPENPRKVDARKCISCTACIRVCEQDARGFFGPMSRASRLAFEKLCNKRKDPEWFI